MRQDTHARGGLEAVGAMLLWSGKKVGALNIIRPDWDAESWQEFSINSTPFVNALFAVSDYGYREQQRREDELHERGKAILRGHLDPEVDQARSRYWSLARIRNRTDEQEDAYRALHGWYRAEYAPAAEFADMLAADGDDKEAERTMRGILPPD
jgi:hypothetical protein